MIIKKTLIHEKDGLYDGMETRDIYLKKDGQIIGLHAIGAPDSTWTLVGIDGTEMEKSGFRAYEQWGNEYDENCRMLGRGSFRVHEDIEAVALEMEADGWVSYEGPVQKETK